MGMIECDKCSEAFDRKGSSQKTCKSYLCREETKCSSSTVDFQTDIDRDYCIGDDEKKKTYNRCIFCDKESVPKRTTQQPQLEDQEAINEINRVCKECKRVNPTQVLAEKFHYRFKSENDSNGEDRDIAEGFDEDQWRNSEDYANYTQSNMQYDKPTPCQVKALGPATKGKNVLLVERAGQGKTLVYALPAIKRLDEIYKNLNIEEQRNYKKCNVIIFVPTESLGNQVHDVLQNIIEAKKNR